MVWSLGYSRVQFWRSYIVQSFNLCCFNPDLSNSEFKPTVAIVAPIFVRTFQQRKEVLELISSLDNQTYKAAQIILVDDCSPLAWYMSSATGQSEDNLVRLPANTRLVRRSKNHGPAAARSLGLGLAMAEHQAQVSSPKFLTGQCPIRYRLGFANCKSSLKAFFFLNSPSRKIRVHF